MRYLPVLGVTVVLGLYGAPAAAATLPARFQDTVAISGLSAPTVVRFSPDGRVFVAEERGIVLEYDSLTDPTPTTVVDLSSEVNSWDERGLLGMTLDPSFPSSPYIYLFYTYDAPPGQTAPVWNDSCPGPPAGGGVTDGCPVTNKLVRITLSGNVMTGSPTTLIQDEWCQQFGSHSVGDLTSAPMAICMRPPVTAPDFNRRRLRAKSAVGKFPASRRTRVAMPRPGTVVAQTSPTSEGGSLRSRAIRLPTSGPAAQRHGHPRRPEHRGGRSGNPFASATDRQPPADHRVRPAQPIPVHVQTGHQRSLDRRRQAEGRKRSTVPDTTDGLAPNYGWPCYEGAATVPSFAGFNLCRSLSAADVTNPFFNYQHGVPVVSGETCPTASSVISGISFYSGSTYPTSYDGALFFGDHSRNCIWAMLPGSNGLPDPSSIQTFDAGAAHPVDIVAGPGGDLFYVDIDDGQIHRISYAVPAVTLTAPATGSVTNVTAPTLSGAAGTTNGADSTVTVRIYAGSTAAGTPVQTLTTTANGATWSATVSAPLGDGQYTAQAEQDDNEGPGFSSPVTFSVDTTAPAVTVTAPATGSASNVATPTLSGAAGTASGDDSTVTVRVYGGGAALGTPVQTLTTTAVGATWSATASAPLGNGQYTAQAEQDDSAGNRGLSTPTTFTVDTTPPVNKSLPKVSGSPSVGQTLQCSPGSWSGLTQQTYTERWLRNGHAIAGATRARYRITSADARHMLACQVTARSVAGSTSANSKALLARAAAGVASVGRARVSGTVATVLVSCAGIKTQSCTTVLTLTVTEKRPGTTSTRTVVLGTRRVVLHGGARTTVRLALNPIGKRLLSSRARLPVELTTTQSTNQRRHIVSTQVLTFRATRTP